MDHTGWSASLQAPSWGILEAALVQLTCKQHGKDHRAAERWLRKQCMGVAHLARDEVGAGVHEEGHDSGDVVRLCACAEKSGSMHDSGGEMEAK